MFAVFTAPSWRRRRSLGEQGGDGGDDGSGGGEEGRAEMGSRQNQEDQLQVAERQRLQEEEEKKVWNRMEKRIFMMK